MPADVVARGNEELAELLREAATAPSAVGPTSRLSTTASTPKSPSECSMTLTGTPERDLHHDPLTHWPCCNNSRASERLAWPHPSLRLVEAESPASNKKSDERDVCLAQWFRFARPQPATGFTSLAQWSLGTFLTLSAHARRRHHADSGPCSSEWCEPCGDPDRSGDGARGDGGPNGEAGGTRQGHGADPAAAERQGEGCALQWTIVDLLFCVLTMLLRLHTRISSQAGTACHDLFLMSWFQHRHGSATSTAGGQPGGGDRGSADASGGTRRGQADHHAAQRQGMPCTSEHDCRLVKAAVILRGLENNSWCSNTV